MPSKHPTRRRSAPPPTAAGPRTRFGAWLGRPMTSFHLIIAVAALLTSLGLIMVLSASGVHSYDEDGSPWVIFGKQLIWTLVGLFAFYAAMRMRVQTMRSLAFSGFAVSVVLLVLVLFRESARKPTDPVAGSSSPGSPCSPRSWPRSHSRSGVRTCWRPAGWSGRR